jgi:hypothetical protein
MIAVANVHISCKAGFLMLVLPSHWLSEFQKCKSQ